MRDREKLLEHMEKLGNCVSDLQIDSMILGLLEYSLAKSEYEKAVSESVRIRTVNFISDHVEELTYSYRKLNRYLDLIEDKNIIEVSQLPPNVNESQ